MAVEIVNGAEEITASDRKLWTGVIPFQVIAVNPTIEEISKILNTEVKNEPVYIREFTNDDGKVNKIHVIDFWVKSSASCKEINPQLITKVSFSISGEPFVSAEKGTKQWVNKYGRTAWAAKKEDLVNNQYYIDADSRQAYRGEEDLYKFLFAWLNMTYDDKAKKYNDCTIDIQSFLAGNLKELKALVEAASNYRVKVPVGVTRKEGDDGTVKYYQTTYNKYFLKHNITKIDNVEAFIKKSEYNEWKNVYYYTMNIQEFDATKVAPDVDVTPMGVPQPVASPF